MDALPRPNPDCHPYARQRTRHTGQGYPLIGCVLARPRGAVSSDIAADGAFSQVLQPFPLAHARTGSGIRRLVDSPRNSARDRPVYIDLELGIILKAICVVVRTL